MTTDVGTDSGTITIVSNDPDQGTFTIPVYANALEPPVIAVAPNSFSADLNTGETEAQAVTITNNGVSDLIYEIDLYEQSQQQRRRPELKHAKSIVNLYRN